ncbi:DtxR family Mn-dependent transcriptional regulator [Balneicella halophila]|uniref:DtxR family Mn-dependent transcriptional regulator n=1 Tax=Balneicella halophila TaxID=1537566 RepID=A0A7L4UQU1_BALHA|nr:DtxR family transcriptional regulator [Balneicella halophila]PVX52136.1 DtxR family Mn-dependent transcriptional regulator [Balneicella halophila]
MTLIFNIIFGIIAIILLILFFKPQDGWWYRLKETKVSRDRIILEDILKTLYQSQLEKITPNIKSLVKKLPFREQQTLKILSEMEKKDLVQVLENKVRLSPKGETYALRIVRAHRLWEQFLAEKTGYDKKDWHKLAEKAEHRLTDEHLEELSKELRRPLFDPHGDPIPYGEGEMPEISGKVLASFPEGTIGRIVHIQDEPESIYQQILAENIHIGSQVKILKITPEMVRFSSEGRLHDLQPIVADALTIIPLEKEEITENISRLSQLKKKEKAVVKGISRECRGENRRRLLDLGFVNGTEIKISNISPLGDPIAYQVRETLIALREDQAQYILIQKEGNDE